MIASYELVLLFFFFKVQTRSIYLGCMHLENVQACDNSSTLKVGFFRDCVVSSLIFEVAYSDFRDSFGNTHHETW